MQSIKTNNNMKPNTAPSAEFIAGLKAFHRKEYGHELPIDYEEQASRLVMLGDLLMSRFFPLDNPNTKSYVGDNK